VPPNYAGGRSQSFLVSNGSNGSASDTQDYAGSPPLNGGPHVFATSHPPEGSAYFNGGYVNGQLHSSQLAAPTNPALRGYFHSETQGHANAALAHPGDQNQSSQAGPDERSSTDLSAHQPNGLAYNGDGSSQNGQVGLGQDYSGDGSVFPYSDNTISRVPSNNVMNGNGFYFKTDASVMSQAGQWGGVGGGFTPGQLTLPSVSLHPSYYPLPSQQFAQRPADNKATNQRLQSPLSERGASPELVDINTVPAIKMPTISQGPYPMPFGNVDNHSISAAAMSALHPASGQLHSAPPHMQRFHSAPGVPTVSHTWNHPEPFKASTPGFERPFMRRHGSDWAPDHTAPTVPQREASEADAESKASTPGTAKVDPPQWPQAYSGPNAVRPAPYRFASSGSTASTASSLVNVSSAQSTLPPLSIFPSQNGVAQPNYQGYQQSWVTPAFNNKDQQIVTPNVLSRPMFGSHDNSDDGQVSLSASPEKIPVGRDRQASGVSVLGAGLAGVTFGDREGSIEEETKSWVGSDPASFDGEEDDSDDDGDDDSDDEDFVLNKASVKRKGSTGKRGRGGGVPRTGSVKRRVLT